MDKPSCELCGDFPVYLAGRCHPTAPVRMVMVDDNIVEVRCFIPSCDRFICTLKLSELPIMKESENAI